MKSVAVNEERSRHTNLDAGGPEGLYLDLLKKSLTRSIGRERTRAIEFPKGSLRHLLYAPLRYVLALGRVSLVRAAEANPQARTDGRDWPSEAETMIGLKRLDNLQHCIEQVLQESVPGDVIETGVWRGGASIFMRAVLKAYRETGRRVWVADSFCGLPEPDPARYPADAGDRHHTIPQLAVSLEEVQENFARYGLLDQQVRFLPGWFRDTLPSAPIDRLAVMRLDGDMYGSTMEALTHLYPKLSVGGYAIVDDYGAVPGCRAATEDFRARHGITEPVEQIDWTGVFWKRLR